MPCLGDAQEFSEDLSSAAGAAASRFGTNVMGAFSLAAFRKAEAAAAEGERTDDGDAPAAQPAAEASTEVKLNCCIRSESFDLKASRSDAIPRCR